MDIPRVSVIIPAYNAEAFVADAVRSVLRQNHPNLEVIVVDDGSTDGTAAVLAAFGDAVTLIRQDNHGQSHARNVGLRRATGSVIGFLDADDLWTDDHVAVQLPHLADGTCDFVRGGMRYVRDVGTPNEFRSEVLYMEPLVAACLYARSLVDAVGGFNESMRHGEDLDWHVRIREHGGREKRVPEVAMLYRRHANNMTNDRSTFTVGLLSTMRNRIARAKSPSHE